MSDRIKAKARFAFRSKTLNEWEKENPVLLAGEHGVAIDGIGMQREKIGDGKRKWNDLDWWKVDSPYELAVKNGFNGSELEWLESLKGESGKDAVIDQTFDSTSKNAQSGKAVSEALSNIKEDKTISGSLISIDEGDKTIFDVLLTTNAPANTTVYYGKNFVDENAVDGEIVNGAIDEEELKFFFTYTFYDKSGNSYNGNMTVDGGFVVDVPNYEDELDSGFIEISSPYSAHTINITNVEEIEKGAKLYFNYPITTEPMGDDEHNSFYFRYKFGKTYLLNKESKLSVNSDGSINADNITNPCVIALDPSIFVTNESTGSTPDYTINLYYSVTGFALKSYVDDKTENYEKTVVDQTFNSQSENAQSGKAVWEGIGATYATLENKVDNIGIDLLENHYTKSETDTLIDDAINNIEIGGGSTETWEVISDTTTEFDTPVSQIVINQDADGNSFSLKKMKVFIDFTVAEAYTGTAGALTTGAIFMYINSQTFSVGNVYGYMIESEVLPMVNNRCSIISRFNDTRMIENGNNFDFGYNIGSVDYGIRSEKRTVTTLPDNVSGISDFNFLLTSDGKINKARILIYGVKA